MPDKTPVDASDSVVVHVAQLFYERDMTKQDIAAQLGISRFKVARMLDHAKSEGIVRIQIRGKSALDAELGRALEQRFALENALVVDVEAGADLTDSIAAVAANWLGQLVRNEDVLGVAWGSTLQRVAEFTRFEGGLDLPVVQICGALAHTDRGQGPLEITSKFASQLGEHAHWLLTPALLDNTPTLQELLKHPAISPTVAMFDKVTVALVSIGSFAEPGQSALLSAGAIGGAERDDLAARGAVGDLLVHLFDREGTFTPTSITDRAVAMSVDQLRAVPRVIAVAGGPGKHEAIAGALRTGVINFLVTDAESARFALASAPPAD